MSFPHKRSVRCHPRASGDLDSHFRGNDILRTAFAGMTIILFALTATHAADNDSQTTDLESTWFKKRAAVQLHNQGVELLEGKDLEGARDAFLQSLEFDPANRLAQEMLGDIAYQLQELNEAESRWRTAITSESRDRILEKIKKVSREKPVEEALTAYPSERFIIRYAKGDEVYTGYRIRELLRTAYRDISRDFGHYVKYKIPVILYAEQDFRAATATPHWSGGLFDGKVRLPAYGEAEAAEADLKKVIWHELAHAIVFDIAGPACPVWLNEGLAQYEEHKVKPIDLGFFEAARQQKYLLSFDELAHGLTSAGDPVDIYLFYQQSFMLTQYLVERYKMHRLRELLALLKGGASFTQALQQACAISPRALEIKWLAWLKESR